jgi:hypothetical protein
VSIIDKAYSAFCKERFPLPSEEQLVALESRIGVPLPTDYRRFILQYNGGWFTEPEIVPLVRDCPLDCLTVMYGLGASDSSAELATAESLALFDDNEPPQVVPIGYTLMGNLLFLVTHPDNNGSIGLKIASSTKSFFLATGIVGFFELLREDLDE